ncbi:MAG: hypothetical protein GX922_00480 [Firmicutes bacterium]|nr:hypothetical protein [Bacillota bacterium]
MLKANIKRRSHRKITLLLIFLLFFAIFLPGEALQSGWRTLASFPVRRHFFAWQHLDTTTFQVRYTAADRDLAFWLAQQAEEAAAEVAQFLPHQPQGKPWLVIAPNQSIIRKVFGWGDGTGALGVYVSDTIVILSPQAWDWLPYQQRRALFVQQGPLVHEYTHYVLDLLAGGNYPRWFSEGLAQYLEYKVLGYEWKESASSFQQPLYTLQELEQQFDQLSNQPLAYRQSLSMVSYLAALRTDDSLRTIIELLGQGIPFYQALEEVYGFSAASFYVNWYSWQENDPRWD